MKPSKVVREKLQCFTDLPNIGAAMACDFELLGFSDPTELVGADPLQLYKSLCLATGVRQDPCVLDIFMSVTHFLAGEAPEPWWNFTEQRRCQYGTLQPATGAHSLAANNSFKPKPLRSSKNMA